MPFTPNLADGMGTTEVREQLRDAANYVREIRSRPEDQRSDSDNADVRSAIDFINEFDVVERALTASERSDRPAGSGPAGAFSETTSTKRSIPQQVTDDQRYQDMVRSNSMGAGYAEILVEGQPFIGGQRALISEGAITSGVGTDMGVFLPQGQPTFFAAGLRQQRLFVRDVLGYAKTTLGSVPYIQEVNPTTYEIGASTVSEGGTKPEVEMHAQRVDALIRKIAAWIPVTTEIFEDAPLVQSYIEDRLTYMLLLREEKEILTGNGISPDLLGIRNAVGKQTQAKVGTNDVPATLAVAIAKIENVDGDADFVAMNPIDYWTGLATRHATQFDNGFGGNAPAVAGNYTWGLTPIRTRSMEAGAGLAGAGRLGATLLDRQQVVIRTGSQHGEYFTQNKIAVLAEERIGLQIHRPDWFCEFTVDLND